MVVFSCCHLSLGRDDVAVGHCPLPGGGGMLIAWQYNFDALQIPAGITRIQWSSLEWDQNPLCFVVYKQTL
jgi:hypothetical protein